MANYESYISSNISTELGVLNKLNNIINNFDTETNFEYKQLYISFLYNLNYTLICIIPQYYLYKKIENNKVVCKHWNFAEEHLMILKTITNLIINFLKK